MTHTLSRKIASALAATGLLATGACATSDRRPPVGAAAGHVDATAATFRYLFANNGSALKANAATYCIGMGVGPHLTDPSPRLLSTLTDVTPRVSAASTCKTDVRAIDEAGHPALVFHVSLVSCVSDTDCLFQGGYFEGNIGAGGSRYRAKLIDATWQVTPEGPAWAA